MSWYIFDEHGCRAKKFTYLADGSVIRGHMQDRIAMEVLRAEHVWGFGENGPMWRLTWFAAKMASGYRLFAVEPQYVTFWWDHQLGDLWRSAAPDQKRFPTLAAVEMYLRHLAARERMRA